MSNLISKCSTRSLVRTARPLALALLLGFLSSLTLVVRAQTISPGKGQSAAPPELSQAFVIYQSPDGETVCRDASPAEAIEINRDSGVPLRQINHLKDSSDQTDGNPTVNATSAGLTIVLRVPTDHALDPRAQQAFVNAAAKWEALVNDPITVYIDVDFGTSAFGTAFPSANILGLTSSSGFLVNYSAVRQRLVSHAPAGSEEANVMNSLPAASLPTDIGSVSSLFVVPPIMRALGLLPASPVLDTQTVSVPRIGFNSAFNFDFDPTDGVTPGLTDFDSVAVHEIGHALGFNSEAGDKELNPANQLIASVWDIYRFKPATASTANFSTASRVLSSGVNAGDRRIQFNGNGEVELSTGKPDGTGGDSNQSSHWKDDALGVPYIGIMDPSISRSTHKQITANDTRALDFIGYNVSQLTTPPPPVGTTVQFASASSSANEIGGATQITVTRSGVLNTTSSVVVKTLDDTRAIRCDDTTSAPAVAFARCDYVTTVQTVTFAPNETTKTVNVPLIDDSFGEPNEIITLSLSNPAGASLGTPNTTALTIVSNEAPGQTGANPILDPTFFVRMQYLDFLSREPDAGGMAAWVGTLNACVPGDARCDRASVSSGFFRSQEFELKGRFVFNFYKVSFGRLPQYAEIVADMSGVTGVSTAEVVAKKAAFTDAWAQRQDFNSAYAAMSNTQLVNTLMDRYSIPSITTPNPATPDDASQKVVLSRADLIGRLGAGTLTRAQLIRAVAGSNEVGSAELNSAFVAMQYFGYLRRDPDQGGYNDWLRTINLNPNDIHSMVNGFVSSDEYKLRFGPLR